MGRSTAKRVLIAGLVLALVVGCGRQEAHNEQVQSLLGQVITAAAECRDDQPASAGPAVLELTADELAGLGATAQAEYIRNEGNRQLYALVQKAIGALEAAKPGPCDKPYEILTAYIQQYGEITAARLNLINRGLMMAGIPLAIFVDKLGTAMIVDKATGNTTTLDGVTLNAKQIGGGSTGEAGSLTGAPMNQNIGIGGEQIVPSNFGAGNMNQGKGQGNFGNGLLGDTVTRPINAQQPQDGFNVDSTGFGVSPP